MKKFVIIINLIINYLLISIESAYIIKSDYTIENPVTAKVTITGNVNGQFYLYDDQIDSGTQLKGYYKNGLTPRRELKYDELFRFYAILGYSCRNVTVDRLYNDEFVLVNDEFIYVDVTGSFLPYKFRGRIFDPKKGNSIVFRTNRPSWYFGDDIPHTIVVFEKISNIKNKFRRTACGDVVVVKNRKNDKNVRLINKKETDYINSLRDNNSLFDKQHYDDVNDDNDDEEFNEGEADKIALENINFRFKNKIARNR